MDKAAELAAEGKLDSKAVNALVAPSKPSKPEASQSQGEESKATESDAQEAKQAPQEVPQEESAAETGDSSAPWDDEEEAPSQPKAAPLDNAATADNAAVAGLLDQISKLTEQLQAANDRIAELTSTRESKKATAPMLPQFKSKCFYARLGLSVEQSMSLAAVNKAKRELVKLGYGEGHEAWKPISEAVAELTK